MCVPILRSIGTKLTNLETCILENRLFYLTSCDANTVRRASCHGAHILLIGICISNILQPIFVTFDSKVMAQAVETLNNFKSSLVRFWRTEQCRIL